MLYLSNSGNFGAIVKEHLEAAEVLKKTVAGNHFKQGFQNGHPQKQLGRRGDNQYGGSGYGRTMATKPRKAPQEIIRQHKDCNTMYDYVKNSLTVVSFTPVQNAQTHFVNSLNQQNKPINYMPKIGWANSILPPSANSGPMGPINHGWLPTGPGVNKDYISGQSASTNKVLGTK